MWQERPLTLGGPHENFFYPDPLGFWTELRRWATLLVQLAEPRWEPPEALSLTAVLHLGEDGKRLKRALDIMRPRIVLFLDEAAAEAITPARRTTHYVPDPHRDGQVYEGYWAVDRDLVVGKAPQHPAAHRFYRRADMDDFLRSVPIEQAIAP